LAWKVPVAQAAQLLEPAEPEYDPEGHATHDDWPALGWYWPARQFTQLFEDTYCPTTQVTFVHAAGNSDAVGFDCDQNHFDWSPEPVLRMTEPPLEIEARRAAGPPSFQDSRTMRLAPAFKDTVVATGVGQ